MDRLRMLCNLEHRGAVGADPLAGDGAGILIQIPHAFLKDECAKLGFKLPEAQHYAVGQLFMPQEERLDAHCQSVWERILREEGLDLLGWHAFSVAYSIGDPDDDTKPTPSEMKAFAHQIACMEIDIRAASAHAEKLLPICTQMMER